MLDGTVVAAWVPRPEHKERYTLGSPGFVLLRHQLTLLPDPKQKDRSKWPSEVSTFFTLNMNLDFGGPARVPWLSAIDEYQAFAKSPRPGQQDIRVVDGRDNGGSRKLRGLHAYQTQTAKPPRRPTRSAKKQAASTDIQPPPPPQPSPRRAGFLKNGTVAELTGLVFDEDWVQIDVPQKGLKGIWVRDPGRTSLPNATPALKNDEHRQAIVRALSLGEPFAFDLPVTAGQVLGRVGQIVSDAEMDETQESQRFGVHLELFSEKHLVLSANADAWPVIEDQSGPDIVCEFKAVLAACKDAAIRDVLLQLAWDTSPHARNSDVQTVLTALPPAVRDKIRRLVTKNPSHWGIDWREMARKNPKWCAEFSLTEADQQAALRYSWWRALPAADVGLPVDRVVFHYHPVRFLSYVAEHRIPLPVFFVRRQNGDYVVERPADIKCGGPNEDRDSVQYYEDDGEPDEPTSGFLGIGFTHDQGRGLSRAGAPRLHHVLGVVPAREGVRIVSLPGLSESDRLIWASLWSIEGGLDAVNQYDNGILSVGGIQKTAGAGELQGALWTVKTGQYVDVSSGEGLRRKEAAAAAYRKHFADHGVDVTAGTGPRGLTLARFVVDGTQLEGDDRERLRDFAWAYRFVKAMEDEAFSTVFLTECLDRLRAVRAQRHTFGSTAYSLGEVFRSHLAQALILDTHINFPRLANKIWHEEAAAVWAAVRAGDLDPGRLTWADEARMIAGVLQRRGASTMGGKATKSGNARAVKILVCTRDVRDDEALRKQIGLGIDPELDVLARLYEKAPQPPFAPFLRADSDDRPRHSAPPQQASGATSATATQ